jgi:hypothetical protein
MEKGFGSNNKQAPIIRPTVINDAKCVIPITRFHALNRHTTAIIAWLPKQSYAIYCATPQSKH